MTPDFVPEAIHGGPLPLTTGSEPSGRLWQPIETFKYEPGAVPPKVLIWTALNGVEAALYVPSRSSRSPAWWAASPGRWQRLPAFWMPLPAPPGEQSQ